ncbi:MAG: hypothetical protein J7518_22350 [Nocardioidaceae bacterium]|nr:hypothetical protein [Nocardioidaceae bacterium]
MDRGRGGPDSRSHQRRVAATVVGDRLRRALDVRTLTQREVDRMFAELRRKAEPRHPEDE